MKVVSRRTLKKYYEESPQAKNALEMWYKIVKRAEWTCFADIKKDFNSADSVGNQRFVFNIKGNDYRLVVIIRFSIQRVYIRFVGTHDDYNKINDIKNI
ncbi:mRNA interferase HigB [Porphyromonadaceae bacterium NLAE-zl-C104]|nr:mRNA interferase HigB [Porphyromonadaceae bacterium KH3R12]SFS33300.1 mRNA interferase HigB [Porphyromonadaceae bacterium NLAE-zl-C104]